MSNPLHAGLAVRCYTLAVRAFPTRIRRAYGSEMVATFAASHAAFRDQSPRQARTFAWRATLDAVVAGARERWGAGGIGAPPPPEGRFGGRGNLWSELGSDARFAVRTLRRAPGFAATVVIVLALGVGINGALFTAINATLLAPMPYAEPDELVILDYTLAEMAPPGPARAMAWSWPKYAILAEAGLPLDGLAAYSTTSLTLTGRDEATRLQAEAITPGYFALLSLSPQVGRFLSPLEAGVSAGEAILSAGLWRERFGGDPGVVGEQITLNGQVLTVVGVGPAGFRGLSGEAQLWVPVPAVATLVSPVRLQPQVHWLQAIGRHADGVTLERLQERMTAVATSVDEAYPFDEEGMEVGGSASSMAEARRNPRAQRAVLVVGAAAGLVLLIACANLAALLLARGGDQTREIAVRLALGGSRARVARGLITETLLLALGGGVLGIAVAAAATRVVASMWPASFSNGGWNLAFVDPAGFALDGTALAFTLGLGLFAGLLFGIGPALRLSRADLGAALKEGAKATRSGGGWRLGGRRWLVTAEIAVALVLLIGASLMIASLGRLLDVETGFNAESLLVFEYSLPRDSIHAANPAAFHDEFFDLVRALPRVESAAGGLAPLRHHWSIVRMMRAGDRIFDDGNPAAIGVQTVTDDYFATLQTPLVRGRAFDARDQATSTQAIVISESAARTFFGDDDPIGKRFALTYGPTADGPPGEVIGVAADVLYDTIENGVMEEAYLLQRQNPEGDLQAMVRVRGEPFDVLPEIRAVMASIDPDLAIHGITTADALADAQVRDTRVIMQLLGVFAGMAVLLAAVGIWGVVSYAVVQRRRELGIRMALGARTGQAVSLILRYSIVNAALGVIIGAVAAMALTRYLGALLYEIDPADPATFFSGAAVLFTVALLAAWLPARRATRVDPAETLRNE